MKNFKLTIEYDGRRYCGWQTQAINKRSRRQKRSIQQTITSCLEKIIHEKVNVIAAGRTDSGVHAIGQVVNFKSTTNFAPEKIKSALNGVLPRDIRILDVEQVSLTFHAQYSARTKVYRYFIQDSTQPSAFLSRYSYWFKFPLNRQSMKDASKLLIGRHDFKSFCASGSDVKSTIRTIKNISITTKNILSARMICVEIEADGFLYNMVRNIVGTLLDVGRRRLQPNAIRHIIKKRQRALAGPCIPAKGLFLVRVKY